MCGTWQAPWTFAKVTGKQSFLRDPQSCGCPCGFPFKTQKPRNCPQNPSKLENRHAQWIPTDLKRRGPRRCLLARQQGAAEGHLVRRFEGGVQRQALGPRVWIPKRWGQDMRAQ